MRSRDERRSKILNPEETPSNDSTWNPSIKKVGPDPTKFHSDVNLSRSTQYLGPMLWFFKIFSTNTLAFLAQNKAKLFKKLIITLVFEKKRQFFHRQLSKIAENCDHNIDPRCAKPILCRLLLNGNKVFIKKLSRAVQYGRTISCRMNPLSGIYTINENSVAPCRANTIGKKFYCCWATSLDMGRHNFCFIVWIDLLRSIYTVRQAEWISCCMTLSDVERHEKQRQNQSYFLSHDTICRIV
jgi:hypothetical protein